MELKVRDLRVRRLFQEREFLVSWKAPDTELSVSRYFVYRSFQYFGSFQRVGEVAHTQNGNFVFLDTIPFLWGMFPYYRVSVVYVKDGVTYEASPTDPVTCEYFSGAQVFPYTDAVIANAIVVDDTPSPAPELVDGCDTLQNWSVKEGNGSFEIVEINGTRCLRVSVDTSGFSIARSFETPQDWSSFNSILFYVLSSVSTSLTLSLELSDGSVVQVGSVNIEPSSLWGLVSVPFGDVPRTSVSALIISFEPKENEYYVSLDDISILGPGSKLFRTSYPYHTKTLSVYVNGVKFYRDVDFVELGPDTFKLLNEVTPPFVIRVSYVRVL